MDAAGVALATKISNVLSAALVIRALCRFEQPLQLNLKKLHIHWETLKDILWIGIPAGIQSALYSVSNLFIQSSVNSLGSLAMAGNAATQSLEGLASIASGAYYQTAMSFTGQNLGGKKYKRIIKSILICILYASVFGLVLGVSFIIFGKPLMGLYNPDPDVIRIGLQRFVIMMSSFWLAAIMDAISGSLRGLGHSVAPTVTTIMGACVLRIGWALIVFPRYRTMSSLMISYPISWFLISLINGLILFYICRKMMQNAAGNKKYILCPKA
jgi:Na+-driven multidrug efflux pump